MQRLLYYELLWGNRAFPLFGASHQSVRSLVDRRTQVAVGANYIMSNFIFHNVLRRSDILSELGSQHLYYILNTDFVTCTLNESHGYMIWTCVDNCYIDL